MNTTADVPSQFPPWNREELIQKIQAVDECTRREAEVQIDDLVRSSADLLKRIDRLD